ncbi:NTF2-like domain protein [Colletotrichum tofieldiae]|uniref:NTF2-like domain protein n=1 Tax=Colletotrichum tofieldiae TaxID=708197 RepID=A0A166Y3Z8_9PEZI|nr:NTF2-like domain protein [Colletotrichum tofieldiae]GKT95686.1 NTF2-like domain protein [Colletotrichum tofieldiae]
MAPTQSQKRAVELAHGNLFDVFGNHDAVSRHKAITSLYHENGVIYEPNGVIIKGHDAIDKHIQGLLENNAGWEFKTTGPVKQVQDLVFIAWTFGPNGSPSLEGADHIIVEDGKIKFVYVQLGDQADIKL